MAHNRDSHIIDINHETKSTHSSSAQPSDLETLLRDLGLEAKDADRPSTLPFTQETTNTLDFLVTVFSRS